MAEGGPRRAGRDDDVTVTFLERRSVRLALFTVVAATVLSGLAGTSASAAGASTTTTLDVTANPVVTGQADRLKAAVSNGGAAAAPTGTVQFSDGGSNIGGPVSVTLNVASGKYTAVLPWTFEASGGASQSLVATYSGDANNAGSVSSATLLTVNQAGTSVVVDVEPRTAPGNYRIAAAVKVATPGAGVPTGLETFTVDGAAPQVVALDAFGHSHIDINGYPVGTHHTVDVSYSGDANYTASDSGVVNWLATLAGGFLPLTPTRLLDTRIGLGAPKGAVAAGGTVVLPVAGMGGVPASAEGAVVLNVTVTAPTGGGYITVYPDGITRPTASNLNFVARQTVPNLVVAQLVDGMVDLYNGSGGTVQLVADVSGYYVGGTPTAPGAYVPLVPTRLLDTRSGIGAPKAAVGPAGTVNVTVAGMGGVALVNVASVVLNVTVTAPTSSGYVTVYPDGTTKPTASNLNFRAGQTVPNLVIAPVGADGKVDLFNGSNGTVQLVADVLGFYIGTGAGTPGSEAFASLTPTRLLDTRSGTGAPKAAVAAGGTVSLTVDGVGGVPATGVAAVVLNVTVTGPTQAGYVTVYADGTARPTASNLNFVAGQTVPNLVIAPVGADAKIDLYNGSGGTLQLVADGFGYQLS
jgi:hypothetical protein